MSRTSSITIPQGYQIGYGASTIAEANEVMELGEGTHYLLARNGRGKTTLMRSIAGSIKSIQLEAQIEGRLRFVPEDISYEKHLNAKSIINILVPKQRREECFAFAELIELDVKKNYRSLSTGNQRKISWLMAEFSCVAEQGNVLLLDEPFTGLDSYVREKIMQYWAENDKGICRVVSCHPDFDSMRIESAVVITDGEISHAGGDEMLTWGEIKGQLH